jgi:hypothetical protein
MDGSSRYADSLFHVLQSHNRVSITVNLRQALKAEDERTITQLLSSVDVKTVGATAQELTGDEATVLLEKLSKMVTVEPRRLGFVVEWTRELLLVHSPYLASQTRTKLKFKPILDILTQRLSEHSELVRMKMVTDAIIRNASDQLSSIETPTNASSLTMEGDNLLRWSP